MILTLPLFFPTVQGGDYETKVGTDSKKQYFEYNYTETGGDHTSVLNYSNISKDDIDKFSFEYDYDDIVETLENESITRLNVDDYAEFDFDEKRDKNPVALNLSLDNTRGNDYDDEKVSLKNGTYQNTTYNNNKLYVLDGYSQGWYRTPWIEYDNPRKVDGGEISGDYDKIEYRTDDEENFSLMMSNDEETIQSVGADTVADSFQYKIYLDNNKSYTNESYVYQIQDGTQLIKLDKYTGVEEENTFALNTFRDMKIAKNHIYAADNYKVTSLYKSNLSKQWEYSIAETGGTHSIAYSDDFVYATNSYDDYLYQIYRDNGTLRQKVTGNFKDSTRMAAANDYGLFTATNDTNYIYRWNKTDLSMINKHYVGQVEGFALYHQYVYYHFNRTVLKLNMMSDELSWSLDTSYIQGDSRLREINHVPMNDKPISVSDYQGTIYTINETAERLDTYTNDPGAKNYYLENGNLYFGVDADGKYKKNIFENNQLWYQSHTGDFDWIDSYLKEGGTNQSVRSFSLNFKDGQYIYIHCNDEDGDYNYYNERWIDEYYTYETTIDEGIKGKKRDYDILKIFGDKWQKAKYDINIEIKYGKAEVSTSSVYYSFNNKTNESISTKNLDISSSSNTAFSFNSEDYHDVDNVFTEDLGTNKTIRSVNATITIHYSIYKTTNTDDYLEVMTDLTFFSLLFLIMGTGFIAFKSRSAGIPVLVFVIGLYPLSLAEIVSWKVTIITTFLFLGFYIMYSMKRENKV